MIQIHDGTGSIRLEGYQELVSKAYSRLGLAGRVAIRIGDEAEGRDLNRLYRGLDYPTDVLSFPMAETLPDEEHYLGDIFICLPVAVRQAEAGNRPLRAELLTLMIHGLLHLAGHDHETDGGEMMQLQDQLERALDINQKT